MPENRREYLREYQREWLKTRRNEWINANGPCAYCGSTSKLEVDHIDPLKKSIEVRQLWSSRESVRNSELSKCQVLCHDCHKKKTAAECHLFPHQVNKHGTRSKYKRGCRCELCKDVQNSYQRRIRAIRKGKL